MKEIQMQKNSINPDKLFHLRSIDLSRIDLDDRRFCFRFFHKPSNVLLESVRRYGIIYAPLVRLKDDTYKVLDGFKRLEAARLCHVKRVFCKVYVAPIKEWDLGWFILSLFLSDGPPNILDQGVILAKMCELFGQDRIIKEILPLLGHPPNQKVLARLLPLSGMEEALGKALLDGKINQDMALRLMKFASNTRKHIFSLFLFFDFSQSKQFEILEYLIDISARENRSLTEILQEMGWGWKRQKPADENIVKAGETFRRRLRERRNPTISGLEKKWKNKIRSLHLPPSISLSPPPYFEGGTYRLSFTFNDLMGLKEKMEELKALIKKDEWHKIFPK
jgi:ParB family chromosome partitioning protein